MASKTTKFGPKVRLEDWGRPEYLDGAQMQFKVRQDDRNGYGPPLGYFGDKADAELFAEAKAQQIKDLAERRAHRRRADRLSAVT